MNALLGVSRAIDWVNEHIGKLVYWLLLAAVTISCFNAIIRKAFNMGSNAYLEAQWYLFAAVFMLGAGYVLLHDQHVRIDVLSNRFSRRTQIWVDVLGLLLFLLPLAVALAWLSLPTVLKAISTGEMSPNAGGLIRWPVYILVPIGFGLLFLQGISELFKRVAFLAGKGPDPHPKGAEKTDEELLLEELQHEAEAREGVKK